MEMLITQALDERDLLKKKIIDAINDTTFVSCKRKNKDVDFQNAPVEKVSSDILATYQSIQDMIKRYTSIVQKIAESNAMTKINIDGKEMTISAAISVLKDINTGTFFENRLLSKLQNDFNSISNRVDRNNNTVEANKQEMLKVIIGRNDSKKPTDDDVAIVERAIENDYFEFVDPIDIKGKIKEVKDYTQDIKQKILSAIKISNATTVINID